MLEDPLKNSPITTGDSWYTPHKHKNPSYLQTNPSMNPPQFHSNQYSSIELSQSLADSPSFFSPSKELGSFLMTPNYSSKPVLPSSSQILGNMRLKTESIIETSRFYDFTGESKNSLPETNSNQIKDLLRTIGEIRQIKAKKTFHARKLNEKLSIQSFLSKQMAFKEQSIMAHKLKVEERIQQRNKLEKKVKEKKARIKAKTKNFLDDLTKKVQKIKEELDQTCTLMTLDEMVIARYQQELSHINQYCQPYPSPYFTQQNYQGNEMLQSKAEQMNYQNIPGFYSNPSSSRSYANTKRSDEINRESSGQERSAEASSNFSIQDLLKNHFSSMMGKEQIEEKNRKFSFGQNPSFCMESFEKHGSGKKNANNQEKEKSSIMEALAMKVREMNGMKMNPEMIFGQKKFQQNEGPIFVTEFDNLSPIAKKNVKFTTDLDKQVREYENFIKLNEISTEKKDFGAIIQQLDGREEDQEDAEVEFYNESVVAIDQDTMVESKYKNSPRLNFNKKHSESPQHQRTQSGQTAKKSMKLPLVLEQSIVQIACQSSTYSDNNLQHHEFSPRKQEEVKRRVRSPTHQVMPAIYEEMNDLRKTENKLKGSNKEISSSRHSGAETPIFRSEASEQEQNLGFSRPFLGGSMKESQILGDQGTGKDKDQEITKSKRNKRSQNAQIAIQERAYQTALLNQSKGSEPYSIYQTENFKTIQTEHNEVEEKREESEKSGSEIQDEDDDDDFYSCTLRTESQVYIKGATENSKELSNSIEQVPKKNSKDDQSERIKTSKSRYTNGNQHSSEVKDYKNKELINLVLENAKQKNYDMSLNMSDLGEKKEGSPKSMKRISLEFNKKGASVELERYSNDFSDASIEKDGRNGFEGLNNNSMSTL